MGITSSTMAHWHNASPWSQPFPFRRFLLCPVTVPTLNPLSLTPTHSPIVSTGASQTNQPRSQHHVQANCNHHRSTGSLPSHSYSIRCVLMGINITEYTMWGMVQCGGKVTSPCTLKPKESTDERVYFGVRKYVGRDMDGRKRQCTRRRVLHPRVRTASSRNPKGFIVLSATLQ